MPSSPVPRRSNVDGSGTPQPPEDWSGLSSSIGQYAQHRFDRKGRVIPRDMSGHPGSVEGHGLETTRLITFDCPAPNHASGLSRNRAMTALPAPAMRGYTPRRNEARTSVTASGMPYGSR